MGKDLSDDAQEGDTPVVVTIAPIAFVFVQGDDLAPNVALWVPLDLIGAAERGTLSSGQHYTVGLHIHLPRLAPWRGHSSLAASVRAQHGRQQL